MNARDMIERERSTPPLIIQGDSLEILKTLGANSIDSVVTDPPYGLSFMGKKWDYEVPSVELWREVLRVLKPGGHLLSFGGTRTYHRLVVNIEDAGFEIRDQIQWIYGSGFPKSHNLEGAHEGWGTALKPANEPICVARKPLAPKHTVAQNVQAFGTGALNIDASRIGTEQFVTGRWPANILFDEEAAAMLDVQSGGLRARGNKTAKDHGANYEATSYAFGGLEQGFAGDSGGASRFFYCAKASKAERNKGLEGMPTKEKKTLGDYVNPSEGRTASKSGSEMANHHPTVKPVKLMEYLVRLVTPPGGVCLDPFMGSGTTGVACKNLGFEFVGIERDENYVEIARRRLA